MKLREFRLADDYSCFFRSGGVCAGVSYAIGMRVWLVRVIWLFLAVIYEMIVGNHINIPTLIYILLWFVVPEWDMVPEDFEEVTGCS